MTNSPESSRRSFLRTSAGAAAVAGWAFPAIRAYGANETIRLAAIGTGGRCGAILKSLQMVPGVKVVGACDVYGPNLDAGLKLADSSAVGVADYRAILDRKDVDAVIIATPDHWHTPMTIAAVGAGKDVYVEKPVTHDLGEGKAIIEARTKSSRVVQVGTQQRSMPHIQKARELVQAGRLGPVRKVHLSWNRNTDRVRRDASWIKPQNLDWKAFLGNAPDQPFDAYRFHNWRWFWDFGGGIFTDLMVHFLDVAHWFLDLDHPTHAASIGAQFVSEGVWETPDTVQTLLTYPGGLQIHFEGTFCNARERAHIMFMGSDADLYIDRGRYELSAEPGKPGGGESLVLGSGEKGLDFYAQPDGELLHLINWVDCLRSRATPAAPVEAGVSAASGAHLANRALRTGQVVEWKDC